MKLYDEYNNEYSAEELANLITYADTSWTRDSLGEWPRFCSDRSVIKRCQEVQLQANLDWIEENLSDGDEFNSSDLHYYGRDCAWYQTQEIEIDTDLIFGAIESGESIEDIIREIKSESTYSSAVDFSRFKIVPTTAKKLEEQKFSFYRWVDDEYKKNEFRVVILDCDIFTQALNDGEWEKCGFGFDGNDYAATEFYVGCHG